MQRWVGVTSRVRVAVSLGFGAIAAALAGAAGLWGYAPLCGWDVAAAIFVSWVWLAVRGMGAEETARHALREDPGRVSSDIIVLTACVASLSAVAFVLMRANSAHGSRQDWLAALAVASVAVSWMTVHSLFALRYARVYYAPPAGGVDFKQKIAPRYVDFAYLAFTVGMTFQVSDTDLTSPTMRGNVLRHALLSFLFGAVILAATVNLVASLGAGHG
jgi:uncharacterized membrane protein